MKQLVETISQLIKEDNMNFGWTHSLEVNKDFKNFHPDGMKKEDYIKLITDVVSAQKPTNRKPDITETFTSFVEAAYDQWEAAYNLQGPMVPFRFNLHGGIKLASFYWGWFADQYGKVPVRQNRVNIGGVVVTFGDGLGGVSGLKFESALLEAICKYVMSGCEIPMEYNKTSDIYKALSHIKKSDLNNELLKVSQAVAKNVRGLDNEDLVKSMKQHVQATGGTKTHRGIENILDNAVRDTGEDSKPIPLEQSGQIISDITLMHNGAETYLSVKNGPSQLSGVTVCPTKENPENWWKHVFEGDAKPDDMDKFNKFWDKFGLSGDVIVRMFEESKTTKGLKDGRPIPLDINEDDLSTLQFNMGSYLQNLVGGNYWYVTPSKCIFVPAHKKELPFIIQSANMSATGKTINIIGKYGDIKAKLTIRSDGSKPYPTRLFPTIDVEALIGVLTK